MSNMKWLDKLVDINLETIAELEYELANTELLTPESAFIIDLLDSCKEIKTKIMRYCYGDWYEKKR